uniref:Uncharacterized protein n=1 Tax=Arundo donax TaxID=35708 RepID=A0A0A9HRD1_ARUDO
MEFVREERSSRVEKGAAEQRRE